MSRLVVLTDLDGSLLRPDATLSDSTTDTLDPTSRMAWQLTLQSVEI
ncbi:hypothetical protein [Paenibacillus cremeus]|nr:hypothetical protein [Paenibacillus cremeus]